MILPRSSKIKVLFDEAEDALKRYERINLSNLVPAVNELRYAGHHLLWAEMLQMKMSAMLMSSRPWIIAKGQKRMPRKRR